MNCTNCQKELSDSARFCDDCGMQVISPVQNTALSESAASTEAVLESPVNLPLSDETIPLPKLTETFAAQEAPAPVAAQPAAVAAPPPEYAPAYAPAEAHASYPPPPPPPGYAPSAVGIIARDPQTGKALTPILSLGQAMLFFLVVAIPVVGIVMLCVWAFGGSEHPSRQNLARAVLIWGLIFYVLAIAAVIITVVTFSAQGLEFPWNDLGYYYYR